MCDLCDFVSPLGMSVFEIQLLATDYKLLTRLLLSNSNHKRQKCAIYMILLDFWVCLYLKTLTTDGITYN
jgi:hypothetical protein